MPPTENTNKNAGLENFTVGIDPVFKGNPKEQKTSLGETTPAGAFNVLNSQGYIPTAPTAPKTASFPANSNNPKSILRTYKSDLESAINDNHLSSINIAIAQNDKMRGEAQAGQTETAPAENYSKTKVIIFLSLILIIAGLAGLALLYIQQNKYSVPINQIQEPTSIITAEYRDELNANNISGQKLLITLSDRLYNTQIPVNNLYNVFLTKGGSSTKRLLNAEEFTNQLNLNMPDLIKRTVLPDFMVGAYSADKNLPFVIFKTASFDNTYAGMLTWEKNLPGDFQKLFRLPGYDNNLGILAQLAATTTKPFEDAVIVNKDVRLLRDGNGQIELLYGIIDKQIIIITVNDTAFKALVDRLNKEKGLQR